MNSRTVHTPDPADMDEIARIHGEFTDRVNDMAMSLQDASYRVGRKRGAADAAECEQRLRALVDALDRTTWSSWQTTASFNAELEAARKTLSTMGDTQ